MPASEARQLCAMATMRQRTAQQPLQELREPPSAIIFNWKLEKTRNTADLKEENSNTNSHLCFEQLQTSLFSTKKTEQSQLWLTVECKTSLKENKIYIPCFSHTQKPKPQLFFKGPTSTHLFGSMSRNGEQLCHCWILLAAEILLSHTKQCHLDLPNVPTLYLSNSSDLLSYLQQRSSHELVSSSKSNKSWKLSTFMKMLYWYSWATKYLEMLRSSWWTLRAQKPEISNKNLSQNPR